MHSSASSVVSAVLPSSAVQPLQPPPPMYNPFALQKQQQQQRQQQEGKVDEIAAMLLGPPPSTPPRAVFPALTLAPPSQVPVNPQLLAAYTHIAARASPTASPNASPSPAASVSSSTAANGAALSSQIYSTPKRTVISVVTNAYLAEDPQRAQAPEGFDPLQPNRRGLPKTALEFWRYVEAYFALPSARELEMLSVCAWPQQDEVLAQVDAEVAETTVTAVVSTLGESSSQGARAARRAPPVTLSAVDQVRAQRQQIVQRLDQQEAEQEQKLKLEEMLHEAATHCNKPDAPDSTSTAMTDAAVPDSQTSLTVSDSQSSEMQLSPSSLVTAPLVSSSTLAAARRRFLDSRAAAQALEGGLSVRLRELNEEQVRMLMCAVWSKMKANTQSMFYAIDLSPDCIDAALNACASFLSSLPPRAPRALIASSPAAAATSARPAHLQSVPKPVNAAALYPPLSKDGEEEDDDDKLLDVERMSLSECLEQLDQIEASNINTALQLQHNWTRYMIATMHAAHPGAAAAHVSPAALADLNASAKWAHEECNAVNVRWRRPFSFSINGSYSARANDRRRLDLVVTKSEKVAIDNWIRESGPQRPVMVNGMVAGKGAGKGAPERVDSKYHLLDAPDAQAEAAAAAARAALPSPPEEEPEVVCSVCADGECDAENEIIFCDRCDVPVHTECYGVTGGVPAGEWYCAPCSLLISQGHFKVTPSSPQFSCAVCWQKGGAMHRLLIEKKHYAKTLAVLNSTDATPPAQLTFAHMFLIDPDLMTPISGLHNVSLQRFKLKCQICKKFGGACVQCSEKKCCAAMHMQCALEHGNRIEVQTDTNSGGGIYTIYCEKHAPLRSTVLKAVDGQVSGGSGSSHAQCQVCCYGVRPEPIEGVSNDMLACTHCDLQVHRWCFGEDTAAGQSVRPAAASASAAGAPVPFLCRVCERKSSNSSLPSPSCALCLTTQGALKPTVDGRWCCLPCTYFTPELFFKDTRALEPIDGLKAAFKAREKLTCSLCDRTAGAPIQCFNTRCATAYHTSCAYASGFEFTENPKGTTGSCPFITHCGVHSRASSAAAKVDVSTNPAYANATFTTFTLPNAEDEHIDLTQSGDGAGGAAGGGSGSKAANRKRGRGSYAESDNDSDVYEDVARAKAASLASAGGTSRQRESRAKAELKMSSNGIGQLVFEKKGGAGTGRARTSGGSSSAAAPSAAAGAARRRYCKIAFLLDHVPVHIRILPMDPTEVFIQTESDASAAALVALAATPAQQQQEKKKRGRFQQQSTAAAANLKMEDDNGGENDSAAATAGDRTENGSVAAAASSSSAAADTVAASSSSSAAAAASSRHRAKRRRGAAAESQAAAAAAAASSAAQRPPSTPQPTSRMPRAQQHDAAADTDSDEEELGSSRRRSHAEDEPLYCLCRRPHHSTDCTMIGCDECGEWFHITCVGVDQSEVESLADRRWECPPCVAKHNL